MADLTITPTSVAVQSGGGGQLVQFAETTTPGDALYRSTSDGKYYLADCDAEATAKVAGIAITYGSADDYGYMFSASSQDIDLGATLTSGEIYVVSDTAGNIMPYSDLTTGQYLSIIGFARSTSLLKLDINVTGFTKA
jgi:hypothetical protein